MRDRLARWLLNLALRLQAREQKATLENVTGVTHAYVAVHGGLVKGIVLDLANEHTAEGVARAVRAGAYLVRLPLAEAKTMWRKPWPSDRDAAQM